MYHYHDLPGIHEGREQQGEEVAVVAPAVALDEPGKGRRECVGCVVQEDAPGQADLD